MLRHGWDIHPSRKWFIHLMSLAGAFFVWSKGSILYHLFIGRLIFCYRFMKPRFSGKVGFHSFYDQVWKQKLDETNNDILTVNIKVESSSKRKFMNLILRWLISSLFYKDVVKLLPQHLNLLIQMPVIILLTFK